MNRREFGRRVLQAAAVHGLRTVSASHAVGLGLGFTGCSSSSRDVDAAALDGGRTAPEAMASSAAPMAQTQEDAAVAHTQEDATVDVQRGRSVIIVGSGYGAAVTALRLTEAGIPVTMIEMGRFWNTPGGDGKVFCPLLEPDGRAMWLKDKTEAVIRNFVIFDTALDVPREAGVLDVLGPSDMRVFCGRGVGGGSLVNLAVYVTPVREVFQRVFPRVDVTSMFEVYYPRAKRTLRADTVPASLLQADCYQYSRTGIAAAQAAGISCDLVESGYDYAYMQMEVEGTVPRSALAGEAAFGNNYGKRSLDQTYLAEAMGTGLLTLHVLHQVTRITRSAMSEYVVHMKVIDVKGQVLEKKELACTHLFLGGGSMGTSELLVRARTLGDLPDLSEMVGTQWGPNSDIFVARDNPLWAPTGALQASVPSSSFRTRDARGKHVFSMFVPFPVGIETWISLNLVMTENPEAGYFTYDATSDSAVLQWAAEQNDPAVVSARSVFDTINVKSGTSYSSGLFAGGDIGSRATYHPVGGCPLGLATDDYGRLKPYSGLYAVDSSLIAVGIGANPALTVTALAERNIERIISEDFGA
jgi:cholesterol oxidase